MKTKSSYITLNRLAWHLNVDTWSPSKPCWTDGWCHCLWTLLGSGRSHRPAWVHHSGDWLQIQTMVESSFQVLLKQDINECGTGEGLQSVITQPQLQTYIYTHTHTQAGRASASWRETHWERRRLAFWKKWETPDSKRWSGRYVYFFVLQHEGEGCCTCVCV